MDRRTAKVARGTAQEHQDHDAGENQADAGFLNEVLDGGFDEQRLVEDHGGFERGGNVDQILDGSFHAIDDGDGVAVAALLQYGNIHRPLPIDADDVGLDGPRVFRLANIAPP